MSPLFTCIVIIMGLLAVMGIVVGVANDAVNFLNSALGSKVAPRRVILWIAAAGILVGTLTSSGMMEVARSGVFYPGQFSFQEIMMLFLGMMLGNILLLDLYNTLGLPTSTTVSMVFGLLGAGVAAALFHIWGDAGASIADLSQYINTGKAMAIIAAILLSVALAFAAGSLFMYVSRLIFSFRFAPVFRRWGAVWCGISLAGILYFALFKGLKSSGLIPTSVADYVGEHVLVTLLAFWAASSVVLWLLQRMRLNIMRITILSGTFALALAFAGNDLVNFIGVPLASYDAWQIAREAGSESIMMGELAEPARANFLLLLASGLVMVLTLFFSKKSQHVTETELSLASQHEGEERFGSTFISRSLVRATLVLNTMWTGLIPVRMQKAIDRRFEPLPAEERSSAPYDMIRAVVNLTAASILIAIGTSYQLPLSTTYVVFMVAMGSSLADRTWGRESAVYRITGVMAVISGWFITALGGFLIAFGVTLLLLWGGWIAVTVLVALCAWLLVRSHRNVEQIKAAETKESPVVRAETPDEVLCVCIGEVCTTMEHVTRIYNRTLVAVFKENRKVLKEMVQSSDKLFEEARDRKYDIMPTLRRLQQCDIDTGHFYVQVVDYLSEVTKALIHITRPAYEHINNNHEGLTKEQIVDLMRVNDQVEAIFDKINDMLRTKDFSDLDMVLEMRDKLFDRRGHQEPAAPHQRRRDGEHTRQRPLPDDPQRNQNDDPAGPQPAQIAALFFGAQKIARGSYTDITRTLLFKGGFFERPDKLSRNTTGRPAKAAPAKSGRQSAPPEDFPGQGGICRRNVTGPSFPRNDGPVSLQRGNRKKVSKLVLGYISRLVGDAVTGCRGIFVFSALWHGKRNRRSHSPASPCGKGGRRATGQDRRITSPCRAGGSPAPAPKSGFPKSTRRATRSAATAPHRRHRRKGGSGRRREGTSSPRTGTGS